MADLSSLSLLRNDPADAERLLRHAEAGDVDAQYAAGLIFAEGRGVEQDNSLSFFWLTVAHEQGDTDAELLRNMVAVNMTEEEFRQARGLLEKYRLGSVHFCNTPTQ